MNIQIVRKRPIVPITTENQVVLLFKKYNVRTQHSKFPVVSIYDSESKYVSVNVTLSKVQSRVPATLLARWINLNYPNKLLTLIDRCNTVGYEFDSKHSKHNKWFFRSKENTIFGLHKIKKRVDSVVTRSVVIDDSLSMQDVKNILNMLDIEVECEYDVSKQRMLKITLKGDL